MEEQQTREAGTADAEVVAGVDLETAPLAGLGARAAAGGALMGLANLVPGISGGTMLLAAGVYPAFIDSIAQLSTLRLRPRPILLIGVVAGAAALAILLLAGWMKTLVVEQRWAMYSLFIGLTLGGVPLVWRLARPATTGVWLGAIGAFGAMLAMQLFSVGGDGGAPSTVMLLLSGLAGASAMILPGVSGGYLLLLLGQYERILGAIDDTKRGLIADAGLDTALLLDAGTVVVPVGIGVVLGIVGVSNLVRWLLDRHRKPTLGALLGLLFGAVVGLWPFQRPMPPPGALAAVIEVEDWPMERFAPDAGHVAGALGLAGLGLGATLAIDRIGRAGDADEESG